MKFEILDHPAELRLRIYGKTIEELFTNAAEALACVQKKNITLLMRSPKECYKNLKKELVKIQSIDLNALLVDFLSEILARSQINKKIYKVSNFKILNSSHNNKLSAGQASLEVEIIGCPVEYFDEDVKAITYQDVDIKSKIKNQKSKLRIWQTDIVLDI